MDDPESDDHAAGRIAARPGPARRSPMRAWPLPPGLHPLGMGGGRDGLLRVPLPPPAPRAAAADRDAARRDRRRRPRAAPHRRRSPMPRWWCCRTASAAAGTCWRAATARTSRGSRRCWRRILAELAGRSAAHRGGGVLRRRLLCAVAGADERRPVHPLPGLLARLRRAAAASRGSRGSSSATAPPIPVLNIDLCTRRLVPKLRQAGYPLSLPGVRRRARGAGGYRRRRRWPS